MAKSRPEKARPGGTALFSLIDGQSNRERGGGKKKKIKKKQAQFFKPGTQESQKLVDAPIS